MLVIDNGGRMDEACIGDLVALEAQAAGLSPVEITTMPANNLGLAFARGVRHN